jgi:hypothetical protein
MARPAGVEKAVIEGVEFDEDEQLLGLMFVLGNGPVVGHGAELAQCDFVTGSRCVPDGKTSGWN